MYCHGRKTTQTKTFNLQALRNILTIFTYMIKALPLWDPLLLIDLDSLLKVSVCHPFRTSEISLSGTEKILSIIIKIISTFIFIYILLWVKYKSLFQFISKNS